jgi:cytoskeletal protein CcmA (bactofilin family)
VRIHGKITGQINAKSVSLAKTANVKGDILHEKLAIEDGARLEGHCRRTEPTDDKTEGENPITLLVKGSSKENLDPPPPKLEPYVVA